MPPGTFHHIPVLAEAVLQYAPAHCLNILDCTLGGAGHSLLLLEKFPDACLWGVDRDPMALEAAQEKLAPMQDRVKKLALSRFSQLHILSEFKDLHFDYILADIGVSSEQLHRPDRGFSFLKEGALDMRMNPEEDTASAADLIQNLSEKELRHIFKQYGEERFSSRIAKGIVEARTQQSLETTTELAELVSGLVPRKFHKKGIHPATLIFQALRIEVNDELGELREFLNHVLPFLNPEGRVAVIAFHSLEDRLVKKKFRAWESPCECPTSLPYCVCGLASKGKVITRRPASASKKEIRQNPRCRSARLRVFEASLQ